MVIAFSGGGTLGHIYPAISIAKQYKKKYPQSRIIFILTQKEKQYIKNLNIKEIDYIYYFDACGLSKNPFKIIKGIVKNILVINQIKKILKEELVDVIIGMGGYISTLSIYSGIKLKKKTIIHEQNSIMGIGNKFVEKYVDLVLLTFNNKKVKNKNKIIVGNPRYYDAKNTKTNYFKSNKNILVTSGTLGAKKINDVIIDFLNNEESKQYTTTLITGKRYYNDVITKLIPGKHYEVLPFTNDMLNLMNKSGIVISRSGATTMYEILGTTSIGIYIPSPNVIGNHQYYNAKEFDNKSLCLLIEEDNLNSLSLIDAINNIKNNYKRYIYNICQYQNTLNKIEITDLINEVVNK